TSQAHVHGGAPELALLREDPLGRAHLVGGERSGAGILSRPRADRTGVAREDLHREHGPRPGAAGTSAPQSGPAPRYRRAWRAVPPAWRRGPRTGSSRRSG